MFREVIFILIVFILGSCDKSHKSTYDKDDEIYFSFITSLDSTNLGDRFAKIDSVMDVLNTTKAVSRNAYLYLSGYRYSLMNKTDSAFSFYNQIDSVAHLEWLTLREVQRLSALLPNATISYETIDELYRATEVAEKNQSRYIYKFYDLIARAYFNNGDRQKSSEFTKMYLTLHPFKNSKFVKQRYYDINFLLAEKGGDISLMETYLDSCKILASSDSIQIVRYYEYEAQLNLRQKKYAEAIKSQQANFDFLKQHNLLGVRAFNNLGNILYQSGEIDKGLHYYQEGIEWANKNDKSYDKLPLYVGIRVIYMLKNDYKNANISSDSILSITQRNAQKIQEQKIAELHAIYDNEKKEISIKNLQLADADNKKIIRQQKMILIGSVIIFLLIGLILYNYYQRKLFSEKNKQLQAENKKLQLEQKIRQIQLNPHFVYNAISNLQGLISSGNKDVANAYLLSLSKLMRNVLELNRQDLISLEDEMESLKNYIELQQMRYANKFDFTIDTHELDKNSIGIPPMLLQPFVENAIEHGLRNLDYIGLLQIDIREQNNQLLISITDNGQVKANDTNKNKQSLSTVIIRERLDMLYNSKEEKARFYIRNMNDEGKNGYQVQLIIPLEYLD